MCTRSVFYPFALLIFDQSSITCYFYFLLLLCILFQFRHTFCKWFAFLSGGCLTRKPYGPFATILSPFDNSYYYVKPFISNK